MRAGGVPGRARPRGPPRRALPRLLPGVLLGSRLRADRVRDTPRVFGLFARLTQQCTRDWPQRCCRPTPSRDAPAAKQVCVVCEEPHQPPGIERVDHLTGSLVVTYYCQRHAPNASDAELCVNTRQLVQLEAATAALRPAFYMPRPHAKASTPL